MRDDVVRWGGQAMRCGYAVSSRCLSGYGENRMMVVQGLGLFGGYEDFEDEIGWM